MDRSGFNIYNFSLSVLAFFLHFTPNESCKIKDDCFVSLSFSTLKILQRKTRKKCGVMFDTFHIACIKYMQKMCIKKQKIHSYNNSQRDALFLKFILIKNSICFGQISCPSSGVSTLHTQQQVFVILVMLTVS